MPSDGPSVDVGAVASGLAARGHATAVLAARGREVPPLGGARVVRYAAPPRIGRAELYEPGLLDVPATAWILVSRAFDVAAAFGPAGGVAALLARRAGGPPVAFFWPSWLRREEIVGRRYRLESLNWIAREADVLAAPDEPTAEAAHRLFGARVAVTGVEAGDVEEALARAPAASASGAAGPVAGRED